MSKFENNFDLLMKGIDKSKNRLETITDKKGVVRKVWKHIETGESKEAGKNAGKAYEKSGKRHTEHSGFKSGDSITFIVGGKEMKGTFRHVNENKHSTVAVVRGEDGKLYERGIKKISKVSVIKEVPFDVKSKTDEELSKRIKELEKIGKDGLNNSGNKLLNKLLQEQNSRKQKVKDGDKTIKQEENEHSKTYNKIKEDAKDGKLDISKKEFAEDINKDHKKEDLKETSKKPLKTSGANSQRTFTEKYKTDWQKGDSVTFDSKDGHQRVGRVLKVDSEINMTTIRLANGTVETVSNKKITY